MVIARTSIIVVMDVGNNTANDVLGSVTFNAPSLT